MCLYEFDPKWHRRGAVDERPRDAAPVEPDGLVMARRPLRARTGGAVRSAYARLRRLAGRIMGDAPAGDPRLRPRAQ